MYLLGGIHHLVEASWRGFLPHALERPIRWLFSQQNHAKTFQFFACLWIPVVPPSYKLYLPQPGSAERCEHFINVRKGRIGKCDNYLDRHRSQRSWHPIDDSTQARCQIPSHPEVRLVFIAYWQVWHIEPVW
jgi:hypothetical protein